MKEFIPMNIECFANRFINKDEQKVEVFGVDWDCEKGFGRLEILIDDDGKPHLMTERMGKEFARRVLNAVIDEAIVEE